jgi:hypothetical protein
MYVRKAIANDIPEINQLFWELDTDAIKHRPEHFQRIERTNDYLMEIINSQGSDFLLAVLDNKIAGFSFINATDYLSKC